MYLITALKKINKAIYIIYIYIYIIYYTYKNFVFHMLSQNIAVEIYHTFHKQIVLAFQPHYQSRYAQMHPEKKKTQEIE